MTSTTIGVRRLVAGGIWAIVLAASASGASRSAPASEQTSRSGADAEFVTRAGERGQRQVDAGKVAVQRAASAEVRTFADRMVKSHTTVNAELLSLADTPPPPRADDAEPMKTPATAVPSGAAFDGTYMEQAVTDHELLVALFEDEAASGKDERLKLWAGEKLSTLRQHLERARALRAKVAAGAAL